MRLRLIILARPAALLWCGAVAAAAVGCSEPTGPKTVYNRDPDVKVPAIKQAVAERDRSVVNELVKNLDSDDAAVRFYAISGLCRLTGDDLGYHYYKDKEQRQPAVARWHHWLEGQAKPK